MRVLVVVPDPSERSRVTSMLRVRGDVELVEVETGAQTKRLLATEEFDVLVLDGALSPQGGFSLLYELHQADDLADERTPPAIVLTDRDDDRWLAGWSRAEATARKPVDPFELAALVRRLGEPATSG